MKRIVTACLVLGLVACGAGWAHAAVLIDYDTVGGTVNGLNNGNLDVPGNPGCCDSNLATGWTLVESDTNGEADTASFASFANNTAPPVPPGSTEQVGLWGKAFAGNITTGVLADADLYQDVPGTPGMKYILSADSKFEVGYAGGVNNVITVVGDEFVFTPSPTDTFLALDFLGAGDSLIHTEQIELKADGQRNTNAWERHMVMFTAPAGTLKVRSRASMVDAVNSGFGGGQSVFFDNFRLECVPEPASAALGLIAMLGLVGLVRRR